MSEQPTRRGFFRLAVGVLGALTTPAVVQSTWNTNWFGGYRGGTRMMLIQDIETLRHRIVNAIERGIIQGHTSSEMCNRIREIFKESKI